MSNPVGIVMYCISHRGREYRDHYTHRMNMVPKATEAEGFVVLIRGSWRCNKCDGIGGLQGGREADYSVRRCGYGLGIGQVLKDGLLRVRTDIR